MKRNNNNKKNRWEYLFQMVVRLPSTKVINIGTIFCPCGVVGYKKALEESFFYCPLKIIQNDKWLVMTSDPSIGRG